MKNLATALLLGVGLFWVTSARAGSAWETDYKKAQEEAKANHKLVLLNFTGSDWCGWCIQLDRAMAERYQVEGFPTLVVLNGEGKTVWRYDGYYDGGIPAFLAELDKVRKG